MKSAMIIFSLLLVLPIASAVQISINPEFSQGETLMAQISGNFLDQVQQQNILLYEGHVRIPFIPEVNNVNGTFYVYGQLYGKAPGNYSLVLTGVKYIQDGSVISADVAKNFTINNNSAGFYVDPGFIDSEGSFSVKLRNIISSPETVSYYIQNGSSQSVTVQPDQEKTVSLSSEGLPPGLFFAHFSAAGTSYSVPLLVRFYSPQNSTANQSEPSTNSSQGSIRIQPSGFNVSLSTNSNTLRYLYLNSTFENPVNVSFAVSENLMQYVFLENSTILDANSGKQIALNITSYENGSLINGDLSVTYGNESVFIPVVLNFSESYALVQNSSSNDSVFQSCADLGGIQCNDSATCVGENKKTVDGSCCLGACKAPKKNNSGKILGWTLASIALVLIILFFIFRYKKAKRPLYFPGLSRKRK